MDKIVNTGKFDFERAQQFDDWLEKDRYDIQPETEEYGISSFVYRAERPFDSVKIHKNLIEKIFMGYIYPEWLDADLHAEEEGHGHNHDHGHKHNLPAEGNEAEGSEKQNAEEETQAEEKQEGGDFEREFRERMAKALSESVWKNVFRSKGMIYVASQAQNIFSWQTAGIMCEVKEMGKWLATETKEELFKKGHKELYEKWENKVQGDRKTQLVIIGSGLDKQAIRASLDECLISEEQYAKMKKENCVENMVIDGDDEDPFEPVSGERE